MLVVHPCHAGDRDAQGQSRRVTDLAEAIENVQQPREFYRQTGRSDFRYDRQNPVFGLSIQGLELTHQGDDTAPFLTAEPALPAR